MKMKKLQFVNSLAKTVSSVKQFSSTILSLNVKPTFVSNFFTLSSKFIQIARKATKNLNKTREVSLKSTKVENFKNHDETKNILNIVSKLVT